jgi:putative ABC transport system permease protein
VIPRELLRARLQTHRTFRAILLAIAGLALIVSGVGIANVMLASVAERMAEIGVRRAVGASRRAVLRQFAIEALLLGAAGGVAGVPAGVIGALAIARSAHWPVVTSVEAAAASLAIAMAVGLGAGLYPARVAAAVTPIDALRL